MSFDMLGAGEGATFTVTDAPLMVETWVDDEETLTERWTGLVHQWICFNDGTHGIPPGGPERCLKLQEGQTSFGGVDHAFEKGFLPSRIHIEVCIPDWTKGTGGYVLLQDIGVDNTYVIFAYHCGPAEDSDDSDDPDDEKHFVLNDRHSDEDGVQKNIRLFEVTNDEWSTLEFELSWEERRIYFTKDGSHPRELDFARGASVSDQWPTSELQLALKLCNYSGAPYTALYGKVSVW